MENIKGQPFGVGQLYVYLKRSLSDVLVHIGFLGVDVDHATLHLTPILRVSWHAFRVLIVIRVRLRNRWMDKGIWGKSKQISAASIHSKVNIILNVPYQNQRGSPLHRTPSYPESSGRAPAGREPWSYKNSVGNNLCTSLG